MAIDLQLLFNIVRSKTTTSPERDQAFASIKKYVDGTYATVTKAFRSDLLQEGEEPAAWMDWVLMETIHDLKKVQTYGFKSYFGTVCYRLMFNVKRERQTALKFVDHRYLMECDTDEFNQQAAALAKRQLSRHEPVRTELLLYFVSKRLSETHQEILSLLYKGWRGNRIKDRLLLNNKQFDTKMHEIRNAVRKEFE